VNLLNCLEKFSFVKNVEVQDLKFFKNGFFVKIMVQIENGSVLYIREYVDENERSYSYHWQTKEGKLIMRWDNAPHHKNISTYPHHKHVKEKVLPNHAITCEEILKEIERRLFNQEGN
jgi:hypothetical protein